MCYATTLVLYLAVWEVGCARHRDHHGVPCPLPHVPTFWYSEVVAVYGASGFAILRGNLMSVPACVKTGLPTWVTNGHWMLIDGYVARQLFIPCSCFASCRSSYKPSDVRGHFGKWSLQREMGLVSAGFRRFIQNQTMASWIAQASMWLGTWRT